MSPTGRWAGLEYVHPHSVFHFGLQRGERVMRSWHHCSRTTLECICFLAWTSHTYALPFRFQAEGSLPAPVWMSAGGLLAPKAFCMNYSVWFLHIETWHPDTYSPPCLPPHTHPLYSIRSCPESCPGFWDKARLSSKNHLESSAKILYSLSPFQVKHSL